MGDALLARVGTGTSVSRRRRHHREKKGFRVAGRGKDSMDHAKTKQSRFGFGAGRLRRVGVVRPYKLRYLAGVGMFQHSIQLDHLCSYQLKQ